MKLKTTENIFVLGIFLGIVGVISALLLGVVSDVTSGPIKEAKERDFKNNLKLLVPDFDATGKEEPIDGITFFSADKNGKAVAYFAKAETNSGYAGKIEVLAALDADGRVLRMMVTDNKETPGLGKDICDRKVSRTISDPFPDTDGLPGNPLLDQYNGKTASANWAVKKDGGEFEFRTGATVTSRALTALMGKIVKTYAANRAAIAGGK